MIFIFIGSKTEVARQIGNAVPPLFAQKIANYVQNLMELRIKNGEKISEKYAGKAA